MRVLVPVFIIAIIAITGLIAIRMQQNGDRRRVLARELEGFKLALRAVESEARLQVASQYPDPQRILDITETFRAKQETEKS